MDCDEHIDQLLSAETARTGDADHVAASTRTLCRTAGTGAEAPRTARRTGSGAGGRC